MVQFSYIEMHKLIEKGCMAFEYAWEHYEELNLRPAVHRLYGPDASFVGALAAGHPVSPNLRTLRKSTRRKSYMIYEFDADFKILRIKHVKDYDKIDCTIHMFEWDGVFYGRMFRGDEKGYYSNYFFAVNNKDDRPAYFAHGSRNVLCVYFYEYPCDDRVNTTCYLYHPNSEFTSAGLRADWDAPMGAHNSPVTISQYDQPYTHIDFRSI